MSDVAIKVDSMERKSKNERKFSAIYGGRTDGFQIIHGLLDRIMKMLNVSLVVPGTLSHGYYIQSNDGNLNSYSYLFLTFCMSFIIS